MHDRCCGHQSGRCSALTNYSIHTMFINKWMGSDTVEGVHRSAIYGKDPTTKMRRGGGMTTL